MDPSNFFFPSESGAMFASVAVAYAWSRGSSCKASILIFF